MEIGKRLLVLSLFVGCFFLRGYAQDNPSKTQTVKIEIDLDKGKIEGPLPIDEFIDLKIISKQNPLNVDDKASLIRFKYTWERSKVPVRSRKFNIAQVNPKEKRSLYYLTQSFRVEKQKNGEYSAELLPYIVTNSSYDFLFRKIFNNTQKKVFLEVLHLIALGNSEKANQLYSSKLEILEKEQMGRKIGIRVLPEFSDLETMYPQLAEHIESFHKITGSYPEITKDDIERLSEKYVEYEMDIKDYANAVFEVIQPIRNGMSDVVTGIREFNGDKSAQVWDYITQIENLESNVKLFRRFKEDIRKILVMDPNNILIHKIYTEKVLVIGNLMEANQKILTSNINGLFDLHVLYPGPESQDPKIARQLKNIFCFGQVITVNSDSTSDEKSGITYLVADVGIMNTLVSDRLGETRYLGRLYFGLNWHPWGFNKKLRFKNAANKRLSYITSFSIGVTIGEIDELGYTDLFNNISPTLGMNVKLLDDVRLGVGAIVLRRDRNPIVDDENLVFRPYVGLSFDLKILKDLLFFKTITNSQQ